MKIIVSSENFNKDLFFYLINKPKQNLKIYEDLNAENISQLGELSNTTLWEEDKPLSIIVEPFFLTKKLTKKMQNQIDNYRLHLNENLYVWTTKSPKNKPFDDCEKINFVYEKRKKMFFINDYLKNLPDFLINSNELAFFPDDLNMLISELNKYRQGCENGVSKQVILKSINNDINNSVFDLVEAMVSNDKFLFKSLSKHRVNANKMSVEFFATLLNQLTLIKMFALNKNLTNQKLCELALISPWRANNLRKIANSLSLAQINRMIENVGNIDLSLKKLNIQKLNAVELVFLQNDCADFNESFII